MMLKVNEAPYPIFLGEAFNGTFAMLPRSSRQIARHSNIYDTVRPTRRHVNEERLGIKITHIVSLRNKLLDVKIPALRAAKWPRLAGKSVKGKTSLPPLFPRTALHLPIRGLYKRFACTTPAPL